MEIIEIKTHVPVTQADLNRISAERTGDSEPILCPHLGPDEPAQLYNGHLHTNPPAGATNIDNKLIIIDRLT